LRNKTSKENFINKPAIYAILYRDKIIYVGQSTSVVNRLCDHANQNALKKAKAKNPLCSK
jgi:predicted GIY-YIG superfamily endonuclease